VLDKGAWDVTDVVLVAVIVVFFLGAGWVVTLLGRVK
jgi:hypothetical protein